VSLQSLAMAGRALAFRYHKRRRLGRAGSPEQFVRIYGTALRERCLSADAGYYSFLHPILHTDST